MLSMNINQKTWRLFLTESLHATSHDTFRLAASKSTDDGVLVKTALICVERRAMPYDVARSLNTQVEVNVTD
jgi:hypothetical protein